VENFILWSAWLDAHRTTLTFFVTSGGLQRINTGTKKLLQEMLGDLGIQKPQIARPG